MKCCHKCGEEWTRPEQPGFKTTCPGCESYLHACVNCKLYNPSADRCSSVTAECTGDREGVTYCEEFQFRDMPNNANHRNGRGSKGTGESGSVSLGFNGSGRTGGSPGERPSKARRKFDQLFGQ